MNVLTLCLYVCLSHHGSALGGGGGVLYCASPSDCLSAGVLSWLAFASSTAQNNANSNNSAWYGPLAATPPVLLTAPVTPQCGDSAAAVTFDSSLAAVQSATVPSGCPLSVSVRLSDALNNTVVSSVADAVVQSTQSTGACAGGETRSCCPAARPL